MDISEKLLTVRQLKKEIDSHGKLPEAVWNKINYRFRLDWNYYSSSMEGNSLTMDETRTIMIGNVTINEKPLKDVLEMKGHDEVVSTILKMGKGELNISEKRIREIHKAIIVADSEEELKLIGEWKQDPNFLYNYKDERFDFTHPNDVKQEIHDLVNWVNAEKDKIKNNKKETLDPSLLAFEFQLRFLTIHPFYDGNGRTARLLMNLILISYGYPPVIVTTEDKTSYYRYLADVQAYSAPKDFYYGFMLDLLIRSQRLILAAIEGKDLDRPDDLDKKLALLEKELNALGEDQTIQWRIDQEGVYLKLINGWISELVLEAVPVIQKFNRFFIENNHHVGIPAASVMFVDEAPETVVEKLREEAAKNAKHVHQDSEFRIATHYGTFKKSGLNPFGCNYNIWVRFGLTKYIVFVDQFEPDRADGHNRKQVLERLLHKPVTSLEMKSIVKEFSDAIFQHIDYNSKRTGLR